MELGLFIVTIIDGGDVCPTVGMGGDTWRTIASGL